MGGVKEQLLDPKLTKDMARKIRREARAPKRDFDAEIIELDRQIQHVVESLASVGRSDALTAKLQQLEANKAEVIVAESVKPAKMVSGAAEKWAKIVSDLENLSDIATPEEVETARGLLREIIGEVSITEKPDGIFAYTKLNATGYKDGAQERT